MPQNSGHFFKHGCYFFRQWQQLSKANPRCWHRGFTFSFSTMIFNGSDQKGPWLPMGQACPSYGLKPCSVPTLLTAGPAAALGLPDLRLVLSDNKGRENPQHWRVQISENQHPSRKEISAVRLPFNKERKPPRVWAKMQVNLPPSTFGFQYQGKKKEGINHSYSMGIKH